ncbi:hypothetical protein IQ07DRAFT_583526, partial [Pyrenochaeta sp. DS3sAY3a]
MDSELRDHLQRLDLSQYVAVLQENGYKSWTQLMAIDERDLDHLGFKRGHRRRLQRHIASMNGYPLSKALLSGDMETVQDQFRLNRGRRRPREFQLRTKAYPANKASVELNTESQSSQNTNPAEEHCRQRREVIRHYSL